MALKQKHNGTIRTLAGLKALDGNEIGAIIAFGGTSVPTGYLPCDGSLVSRTIYAGLFAVIGTTWGAGDGSTTFALPDLTDGRFLEGGTAGTYKDAGLPNIKGSINAVNGSNKTWQNYFNPTGVFEVNGTATEIGNTSSSGNGGKIDFDAHNSNAIYSDSVTTVQPKSATVKYCIRYMRTTTTMLTLAEIKTAMVDMLYPIGARYVQLQGMPEPSTFGGTWQLDNNYNNKTLWCSNSETLGTALTEQLPNITGSWDGARVGYAGTGHNQCTGAFNATSGSAYWRADGTGQDNRNAILNFNAHDSNATYTDNGVVRPASVTCKVWQRTA